MARSLKNDVGIWKLSRDLGLKPSDDPLTSITDHCASRIRSLLREFPCNTLSDLLTNAATKLETLFIDIRSDEELRKVRDHYFRKGETGFALLEDELGPKVLAITFRRLCPGVGERDFISLIDCRGDKSFRSYYSKWHELAHLLTLTDQMRLKFCRTHTTTIDKKDPEEALMEVIAGEIGFLPELVKPHAKGAISFERIDELRGRLCAEASFQASAIGFTKSWPTPAILVEAGLRYKKSVERNLDQGSFGFVGRPSPELRILHTNSNGLAQDAGAQLHKNMRVPQTSIIYQVFAAQARSDVDALENLSSWETQKGGHLRGQKVRVQARKSGDNVIALIVPI